MEVKGLLQVFIVGNVQLTWLGCLKKTASRRQKRQEYVLCSYVKSCVHVHAHLYYFISSKTEEKNWTKTRKNTKLQTKSPPQTIPVTQTSSPQKHKYSWMQNFTIFKISYYLIHNCICNWSGKVASDKAISHCDRIACWRNIKIFL